VVEGRLVGSGCGILSPPAAKRRRANIERKQEQTLRRAEVDERLLFAQTTCRAVHRWRGSSMWEETMREGYKGQTTWAFEEPVFSRWIRFTIESRAVTGPAKPGCGYWTCVHLRGASFIAHLLSVTAMIHTNATHTVISSASRSMKRKCSRTPT
jgi:hypothetical protein